MVISERTLDISLLVWSVGSMNDCRGGGVLEVAHSAEATAPQKRQVSAPTHLSEHQAHANIHIHHLPQVRWSLDNKGVPGLRRGLLTVGAATVYHAGESWDVS